MEDRKKGKTSCDGRVAAVSPARVVRGRVASLTAQALSLCRRYRRQYSHGSLVNSHKRLDESRDGSCAKNFSTFAYCGLRRDFAEFITTGVQVFTMFTSSLIRPR
jgi:hypothetical protein